MKLFPVKASVLALALFSASGAVQAESADATRLMQVAQAEGETQPPPPPEPMLEDPPLPPFDPQQAQPEPQIEQPPLPPFDPQQAQPEPPPEPQPPPQPAVEQVQPEPPAAPAAQPEASTGSPEVAAFLLTVVPAAELGEEALRQQMQRAMALSKAEGLSPDQRSALRNVIREARAELGNKQPPVAEQPAPQPQPPVAEQPAPAPQPPVAEQPQTQPPPVQTEQQQASPVKVDPALERRAQAYLNDTADVSTMKRKQLRKRLAEVRDLLASNRLTPETRDALRAKLARERAVLRDDVAASEGLPPPDQPPPQGQKPGQQQGGKGNDGDQRRVLQDRRPPRELDDRELVRRIDVYRDVVADDRYAEEERMMWRRQMEEDRRYLRRQMIDDRRQREAQLRSGGVSLNINIYDGYEPGYDVPDDLFAAEADDEEIADVLAAPPRRAIDRRYTVDDIERYPDARDAMARIEIDTVNFGFGEGYLREEEIDKLDRIASILERILASHPDEVFLIEGHTDAVGSDAANLALSRQRATAVKEALVTYYVIPPESLQTVGLGERYLKIPTSQPEAENRRVSLARITPLLGQLD
jgi:outer membrane protein OmpA-like peptidoglycan-associated protein